MSEEKSMMGKIIDMSLEDFEKELIEQQVNIGTVNNMILLLESAYHELAGRKETILKLKFSKEEKSISDEEADKAIQGLYAELIKIEQKVTYLKQRSKDLVNVDKALN